MNTSIGLKEQIKALKQPQKEAEKKQKKMKKDFDIWNNTMSIHPSYFYVKYWKNKYDSFETLVRLNNWTNRKMYIEEFEFLFTQLGYTDTEFFITFMSWPFSIFNIPFEDRKCAICLSYYNTTTKAMKKFKNCSHNCCVNCYSQLQTIGGYKCCVICRESEKPKNYIRIRGVEENIEI
jgi:hypothetical protein